MEAGSVLFEDDDAYDLSPAAVATCDLSSTFDDLPQRTGALAETLHSREAAVSGHCFARYSGFVDAVIQRWALIVDEYLQCPQDFALVRYEDFSSDPVSETRRLLDALGLAHLWVRGTEERVRQRAE
ncbi:PDPK2, partial [Symbiodinium pilosum]